MNPDFVLNDIGICFVSNKSLTKFKVRKLFFCRLFSAQILFFQIWRENVQGWLNSSIYLCSLIEFLLLRELYCWPRKCPYWLCSFQVQGAVLSAFNTISFNPHRIPVFGTNLASNIMVRKLKNKEVNFSKLFSKLIFKLREFDPK